MKKEYEFLFFCSCDFKPLLSSGCNLGDGEDLMIMKLDNYKSAADHNKVEHLTQRAQALRVWLILPARINWQRQRGLRALLHSSEKRELSPHKCVP